MFNYGNAAAQVTALLDSYPKLKVVNLTPSIIVLAGAITVHRSYKDFPVLKTYNLELSIPIGTAEFPYIRDIGNHIDVDYLHKYNNGILCLATDTEIKIRFLNGFDLYTWMKDFVEPYYYSYEYYKRYACFPFGDRLHGQFGTLQTYADILETPDIAIAYRMIKEILITTAYRGHHPCLCGSGEKMRNCHGERILPFFKDIRLKDILENDEKLIEEEIKYLNERNRGKTK